MKEVLVTWESMDADTIIHKKSFNPFQKAGFLAKLFFTWSFPLFYKGFRRGLKEEDIFLHLRSHDSRVQGNKLENEWIKEITRSKNNPSLWKALFRVFGKELLLLGIVNILCELVRILQPLALSRFLDYYDANTGTTLEEAYQFAALVSILTLANVLISHHLMFYILHLGQKIRSAASSLVYRKALRLSKSALAETTIGQMVNLISNDVSRFELCTVNIHSLWLGPVELIVVLLLLYYYLGWTGLPGVGLLLCFIPFQMYMGKKTSLYRLMTAIRTDERIRLMNEIITGVQVIKMYTWEKPFQNLVKKIRKDEMNQIKNNLIIRGILSAFNAFLTRAAIASCVLTYVLTGNTLNAKYVYVLSLFFEILRQSINQDFTSGVTQFAEASISVRRIKEFLMCDELNSLSRLAKVNDPCNERNANFNEQPIPTPTEINLSNVNVKWIKTDKEFAMKHINFTVGTCELATVIGKVGSGKSTLLHVILNELPPVIGTVKITGNISYSSQEPWLFMASVKQNILFGEEYEEERYEQVIEMCGLQTDLNLFPYGDRTLVGERGISLSGGQKARINLARAVYKKADIYLLDDPLSAVDTNVGKHIFKKCITGFLREKCVILVTHQLQYLNDCNKIYILKDGCVDFCGTYEEIKNAQNDFLKLIEESKEKTNTQADKDKCLISQKDDSLEKSFILNNNNEEPILEKEVKVEGKVVWKVYKYYFLAGGHWCKILAVFLIFLISQALASGIDYFLTIWVNVEQVKRETNSARKSLIKSTNTFSLLQDFWLSFLTEDTSVIIYGTLLATIIVLFTIRALLFFRYCISASIKLHNMMFHRIVHTAMRFFNINPSGRILNRFSKDMNQVDEYLPIVFSQTLQIGIMVAAITVVVATLTPYILLPTAIILIIFYILRIIFIATTRDIKRFEAITRSPVYSHLTASLQGLTTIRAFGAQDLLGHEFDDLQNSYNSAYFMFLGANRTFGFWLDMHAVVFVTLVTFSFLVFNHDAFGGNVGLAITQSITLTGLFQFGIRQWSEMENTMTCVERIKEYSEVEPEYDYQIDYVPRVWPENDIPEQWPENGNIEINNLNLQYAPYLPYVLKNVTFNVKSKEKVGIVGRTGAGKSSIITALFRLVDIEGKILIDGLNTKKILLKTLRSKISIIPQEPMLFSGTMRKNLDPFDEYSDEALWNALEEVELKQAVLDLPLGLDSKMSEGGSNFSVGQRQLVCLARAILKNNKILVMDEATANVDPQTDGLIQSTIRKKFADCTVLTIAHRLHTIMDSDRVLVMDAGEVKEFDEPFELLQNTSGMFYKLVRQTGKAMADNLKSIAEARNSGKNT